MRRRFCLAVALVAVVLAGGGLLMATQRSGGSACGAVIKDSLDPRSLQHFLPGAPAPVYSTEPPTSGPHQAGAISGGVVSEPIPGPVQVGALEGGQVLLQHRDLAPEERTRLEALAGPPVVVAPNPALPARVVASAWRTRQPCGSVDVDALRRFIGDHAGRDEEHAS